MSSPQADTFDHTLLDFEIAALTQTKPDFIEHFDSSGLKGVSYDIHAGNELYVATADSKGITIREAEKLLIDSNQGKVGFRIAPGQSVVIRSRECIHMPNDI